jgi:hypothetical protein
VVTVSYLRLKINVVEGFSIRDSKPAATVWCLKTKQASVCRLRHKTDWGYDGVGHASRSSGLLHVETSLARVSQSGLKTGGGATADGARDTIMKVASESG